MKVFYILLVLVAFGCTHDHKPVLEQPKVKDDLNSINSEEQVNYIRKKLLSKSPEMRRCFHSEDRKEYPAIRLKFFIERGIPKSITFIDSKMTGSEESCLKDVVHKLKFPLSEDVEVVQPFRFYPKKQ